MLRAIKISGLTLAFFLIPPAVAIAAPHTAAPTKQPAQISGVSAQAKNLALWVAGPWPARQDSKGDFQDYVLRADPATAKNRDTYGPAMLGAALWKIGALYHKPVLLKAGIRSASYALNSKAGMQARDPKYNQSSRPAGYAYPFSMLALADAWNTTHRALSRSYAFSQLNSNLVDWFRRSMPIIAPTEAQRPSNQVLVERTMWQMLLAGGLTSRNTNHILGARSVYQKKIYSWVDSWFRANSFNRSLFGGSDSVYMLSDAPSWPHAYHAFSLGLLARLYYWSSPGRRAQLVGYIREGVRASRLLSSPAGDVAYAGRSTMMPWTLAMTAYAAMTVANDPSTLLPEAAQDRAFARLLLHRLRTLYIRSDGTLWLDPAMRQDVKQAVRSLDPYARATAYTGLTLLGLSWIAGTPDGPASSPGLLDGTVGNRVNGSLAVLRNSRLWLGVRGSRFHFASDDPNRDPRYDWGPMAAQQLSGGAWQWLIPVRPPHATDRRISWMKGWRGSRWAWADTQTLPRPSVAPTVTLSRSLTPRGKVQHVSHTGSASTSGWVSGVAAAARAVVAQNTPAQPQAAGRKLEVLARDGAVSGLGHKITFIGLHAADKGVVYSQALCGGLRIDIDRMDDLDQLETAFWLPDGSRQSVPGGFRVAGVKVTANQSFQVSSGSSFPSSTHRRVRSQILRFENPDRHLRIELCLG